MEERCRKCDSLKIELVWVREQKALWWCNRCGHVEAALGAVREFKSGDEEE